MTDEQMPKPVTLVPNTLYQAVQNAGYDVLHQRQVINGGGMAAISLNFGNQDNTYRVRSVATHSHAVFTIQPDQPLPVTPFDMPLDAAFNWVYDTLQDAVGFTSQDADVSLDNLQTSQDALTQFAADIGNAVMAKKLGL